MKLQLPWLQWHINLMETVTRIRNIFDEALLHMLWLHMAMKGPGCHRRTCEAKIILRGICLTKLKGHQASLLDKRASPDFPGICFNTCYMSSHTIAVGGSPVLPARWSSDVQQKASPERTVKDITTGDHLHPDLACKYQTWGNENLEEVLTTSFIERRGEKKTSKGHVRCSMLSPCTTD